MNRITQQQLAAYFTAAWSIEDNRFMVINDVLIEATTLSWDDEPPVEGVAMKHVHHVVTVWDAEGVFNPSEAEQLAATYKNNDYLRVVCDFTDKAKALAYFWELGKRASDVGQHLLTELEGEKQV